MLLLVNTSIFITCEIAEFFLQKLQRWGIDESAVFGRNASVEGLVAVVAKLDAWLNGNVFPLDFGIR